MAFTSSQLIAMLRADGITTSDISDGDAQTMIDQIREVFDRYRPIICFKVDGITTVKNQQTYSYPSGASGIVDVLWFPNLSSASVRALLDDLQIGQLDGRELFDAPSLTMLWNSKYYQYNKRYGGDWEIFYDTSSSTYKITLYPVPSQGSISVPVIYTKAHSTDLSTIPDTAKSLFYEGLVARVDYRLGRTMQKASGFRAGTYSVQSNAGMGLRDSAMTRYNRWLNRLSLGAASART